MLKSKMFKSVWLVSVFEKERKEGREGEVREMASWS